MNRQAINNLRGKLGLNIDLFGSGSRSNISPYHLNNYFAPVSFQRYAFDVGMWFAALTQIERQLLPNRVELQRMYNACVANSTVYAILEARYELTLLRDYAMYQIIDGRKVYSRDLTQQLSSQQWLANYIRYVLEAKFFGYSLIQLGPVVNDTFPRLTITRREHIRPDGLPKSEAGTGAILTSMVYAYDGLHLQSRADGYEIAADDDPMIQLFNHYVTTPSDIGQSECGYGLLFPVSYNEIHLRHLVEWEADYIEMFGMPLRIGSTKKTGKDRAQFEQFLENMGSGGAILVEEATDKIEFVQQNNAGTGWKSYAQAKEWNEGVITQLLLGHTSGIKDLPGKLGGMQSNNVDGNNENLIIRAINNKQTLDGNFVTNFINNTSAPLFRQIGKTVGSKLIRGLFPPGYYFELTNDREEQEIKRRKNSVLSIYSESVKKMKDAGIEPDLAEASDFTGFNWNKTVVPKETTTTPDFNPTDKQTGNVKTKTEPNS
jgi:hypothetical protein